MRLQAALLLASAVASCAAPRQDRATRLELPVSQAPAPSAAMVSKPRQCLVYVEPAISESAGPQWLTAELPTDSEGWQGMIDSREGYPPKEHVERAICGGEPEMVERLLRALETAGTATSSSVLGQYETLLAGCDSGCELGARIVESTLAPKAKEPGYGALVHCRDERSRRLILDGQASARHVLEWYAAQPVEKRVASRALTRAVRTTVEGPGLSITAALRPIAETTDKAVIRLLKEVYQSVRDPEKRSDIALAFSKSKDPGLLQEFKRLCVNSTRWDCEEDRASGVRVPPRPPAGVPGSLAGGPARSPWDPFTTRDKLRDGVRHEDFVAAMRQCIRDLKSDSREGCFRQLARLDWVAARDTMADVAAIENLRQEVAVLRQFETPEAFLTFLKGLGIPTRAPSGAHSLRLSEAVDPAHVLLFWAGGVRARSFERVLYDASRLHDSPVAGFAFDSPLRSRKKQAELSFVAYGRGKRYELTPEQIASDFLAHSPDPRKNSSGVDLLLHGLVGFLNGIARDAQSPLRFVSIPQEDSRAHLLLVPEGAACALASRGLLD